MSEINKEALTYAFNLLSVADRSEKVLHEKISKRFDEPIASTVIHYLKDNNFINDVRYAKNLVENYQTIRNFGKNRIKVELIKKKIPNDIIAEALNDVSDETSGCYGAASNWLRKKHISGEIDYATKNKLLSFLMRRGFDYDTAKDSIQNSLNNCR